MTCLNLFGTPHLDWDEVMDFGQFTGLARDLAVNHFNHNHLDKIFLSLLLERSQSKIGDLRDLFSLL